MLAAVKLLGKVPPFCFAATSSTHQLYGRYTGAMAVPVEGETKSVETNDAAIVIEEDAKVTRSANW